MSTPDKLARAIVEARREAMAPELWATVEEGRALVQLAAGVRVLALRALRAATPLVDTSARTPRIGRGLALVRGPVVEQVIVSTPLDPLLSLRALASYSGLSVRKLRECLDDPGHSLPCYRVGGKILVRRSDFDAWLTAYRGRGRADVEAIVNDVIRDISRQPNRSTR